MILLGLHGRKRAGKDTLAAAIIRAGEGRGLKVVRRGFADLLKSSAAAAIGFEGTLEQRVAWMDQLKEDGEFIVSFGPPSDLKRRVTLRFTGREFLQWYGTEAHRDVFGDDFWIDALMPPDDWARNFDGADIGVVTDVRFSNEANRVNFYGETILVRRPALEAAATDAHVSEVPLPDGMIDFTVINDQGVENLETYAREIVERYT